MLFFSKYCWMPLTLWASKYKLLSILSWDRHTLLKMQVGWIVSSLSLKFLLKKKVLVNTGVSNSFNQCYTQSHNILGGGSWQLFNQMISLWMSWELRELFHIRELWIGVHGDIYFSRCNCYNKCSYANNDEAEPI